MKRKLLFSLLLFVSLTVFAQDDYEAYYPDGTTWEETLVYSNEQVNPENFIRWKYTVTGDTIIDGKTYKNVERKTLEVCPEGLWGNTDTVYAIREDFGKKQVILHGVFDGFGVGMSPVEIKDSVIYDFSWSLNGPTPDGTGTFDEKQLSTIVLEDGKEYDCYHKIIRTIGRTDFGVLIDMYQGRTPYQFMLTRFERNGVLIYKRDFPIVGTGIRQAVASGTADVWYTLQGVRLNAKPNQRGIYIKNGRKVTM